MVLSSYTSKGNHFRASLSQFQLHRGALLEEWIRECQQPLLPALETNPNAHVFLVTSCDQLRTPLLGSLSDILKVFHNLKIRQTQVPHRLEATTRGGNSWCDGLEDDKTEKSTAPTLDCYSEENLNKCWPNINN